VKKDFSEELSMKNAVDWDWLLPKILSLIPKVIIIAYVVNIVVRWALNLPGGLLGKNDFLEFWVGSSFIIAGKPAAVYKVAQFCPALAKASGQAVSLPCLYPPTFLLMVLPLSLLPYYSSLLVWLGLTLGAYLLVIRRSAPHPLTIWLALSFPGALININYGQNGLFSTALLGGAFLLLENSPVMAGILFGLLSYKPNFFILIPVALIAGRYWRTLWATIGSAAILVSASILAFGWEPWMAYWHIRNLPMQALQQGIASLNIMPTLFAATLMAGGNQTVAFLIQGLAMVASVGAVIWTWSRRQPLAICVSVLVIASLLFTPYAPEYELVRLAIPAAWIGWHGYQSGWLFNDKVFLFLAWITPLVSRLQAQMNMVQVTPLILVILLYLNLASRRLSAMAALTGIMDRGK
jgi:alpha-1,2-mannosyltransferase